MRLRDKVILVTGSSSGIGEAMARRFALEGARVVVHGLEEAPATTVVAAITQAGGQATLVTGSLEIPTVPRQIVETAVARWGRLDGLVNNAADLRRGSLDSTTVESFDRSIAVNVRAPFLLIQAAMPQFRRQGGGRVLNIGSMNAYCGERNLLGYSASKGALMTLTRNLADAHGVEGLRINQFNVGWTLTPNEFELKKREGLPDDWPAHVPKTYAPSGRLLSPDDIAWAAVYFLSDEAPLINGTVLELEQYPIIGRNPFKEF